MVRSHTPLVPPQTYERHPLLQRIAANVRPPRLSPFLSHYSALFCASQFANSFAMNSLRTLLKIVFHTSRFESVSCALFRKTRGVGGHIFHAEGPCSSSIFRLTIRRRMVILSERSESKDLSSLRSLPSTPLPSSRWSTRKLNLFNHFRTLSRRNGGTPTAHLPPAVRRLAVALLSVTILSVFQDEVNA